MKKSKFTHLFAIVGLLLILFADVSAQRGKNKPKSVGADSSINDTKPLQCTSKDDGKTQTTYLVGGSKMSKAEKKRLENLGILAIPKGETERAKQIRKNAVAFRKQQIEILEKSFEVWLKRHPDAAPQELEDRKKFHEDALERFSGSKARELAAQKKWDWRGRLNVGPVLNQGEVCNTCWAFAATNAAQTSLEKSTLDTASQSAFTLFDDELIDLSTPPLPPPPFTFPFVQDLLNCMPLKADEICNKGWHGTAFDFMVYKMGIPMAFLDGHTVTDPDTGKTVTYQTKYLPGQKFSCNPTSGFVKAASWDYVSSPPDKVPTVEELKTALVEHGPLVAPIHSDNCLIKYKGGVFNEKNMKDINHVVLLIGWDDEKQAWLVKNSWGENWGEKGFAWIRYGSNNIGVFAAWINAQRYY